MTREVPVVEDPLLVHVPLPHSRTYFPRGFPVIVTSNSPKILAAADDSWADSTPAFSEPPIHVRCVVSPGRRVEKPRAPVMRSQRNLLCSVVDDQNFACCDLETGIGAIWVSEGIAENTEYFRYYFLEAIVYSLIDMLHLITVHAACVERNGHGVLIAGHSGAGKSSLVYGCARGGWTYVSDDAVSLIRRGTERTVLGMPERFRFRATAGALFPEFMGRAEVGWAPGKPTIEVLTSDLPNIQTSARATIHYILFLNRRDNYRGSPRLVAMQREEAIDRLFAAVWPPELLSEKERLSAIQRLVSREVFELRYQTLDEAIDLLNALTEREPERHSL